MRYNWAQQLTPSLFGHMELNKYQFGCLYPNYILTSVGLSSSQASKRDPVINSFVFRLSACPKLFRSFQSQLIQKVWVKHCLSQTQQLCLQFLATKTDIPNPDLNRLITKQRTNLYMQGKVQPKSCHGCDTITCNLVLLPCNHRLCMSCIKNTKLHHHQAKSEPCCIVCKYVDKNRTSTSPDESSYHFARGKTHEKTKSPSARIVHTEASPGWCLPGSAQGIVRSTETSRHSTQAMMCVEHNQILVMYSERAKEFLCAQCFYLKQKCSGSILPIKNATDLIVIENRVNREESRQCLGQVEEAMRICNSNIRLLQSCESHFKESLRQQFQQLRRELDRKQKQIQRVVEELLQERQNEFSRIIKDLEYLKGSLRQYREYNKESQNLNTMIYVFETYKMIKKTLSNLDLNYHQYTNSEMDLIKINREQFLSSLDNMYNLRNFLPVKSVATLQHTQPVRPKSKFTRSIQEEDGLGHKNISTQLPRSSQSKLRKKKPSPSRHKKQQFSLCNNQPNEPESNLYQRLINEKFNRR